MRSKSIIAIPSMYTYKYKCKVCMAEWLDGHLGSSRSRVENPARVGASRWSRATSRAPVGIPYVDSYLFAPIMTTQSKKSVQKSVPRSGLVTFPHTFLILVPRSCPLLYETGLASRMSGTMSKRTPMQLQRLRTAGCDDLPPSHLTP
jgi:hypothetical protein